MGKSCRKCAPTASTDPFLVLVKTKNSHFMQENLLEIKYFERPLLKNLKKLNLFFFPTQSFLLDKIMKSKRDLELVTSHFSVYKTSSGKFPISDLLPDQFWGCNIKWFLSNSKNYMC